MISWVFSVLALFLGLILGSFYTVCVHRSLTGESIVWPGSHCPACGHPLRWFENIPLVSFFLQRGRCRACGGAISWRYPVLEALSAIAAFVLAWRFGPTPAFGFYLVITGIFLVASAIDWETFLLPDILTYSLALLGLASPLVLSVSWLDTFLGAGLGAGLLWVVREVYWRVRGIEGLGLGDVKLMVGLGALAGAVRLPLVILVASLLALAVFVLAIARTSRSQGLATAIPFGPFLCAGTWLVMVGEEWLDSFGIV